MTNIPEIHLPSQEIFTISGLSVSNTMLGTLVTSVLLLIMVVVIRRKAGLIPSRSQMMMELTMDFFVDKLEAAFGDKERAMKAFPLIFTIFIFLLMANQFTLLPFMESIVTADGVNLFRTPTSDYSLPIALTILVWVLSHVIALSVSPLKHIGNFIKIEGFFKIRKLKDIPMACLDFFLGLMDIVGEVAKLASLSTRLFGNIFAGEVIIAIISGLMIYTQYLVPIPFLGLSVLAGLVQAFVFAMLSILYISSALNGVRPPEQSTV
jgi:F-type H+-transporting ATPase subunit a